MYSVFQFSRGKLLNLNQFSSRIFSSIIKNMNIIDLFSKKSQFINQSKGIFIEKNMI